MADRPFAHLPALEETMLDRLLGLTERLVGQRVRRERIGFRRLVRYLNLLPEHREAVATMVEIIEATRRTRIPKPCSSLLRVLARRLHSRPAPQPQELLNALLRGVERSLARGEFPREQEAVKVVASFLSLTRWHRQKTGDVLLQIVRQTSNALLQSDPGSPESNLLDTLVVRAVQLKQTQVPKR